MEFISVFSGQPRGLHNFISELRNAKSKDDERIRVDKELANIRNKFATSANLTSYDKKKYVWKLCYIYMLGYEVDFGHVEFISLLSSTKYTEKAVGYMAFSMMFRPGDELMALAVNSMRNDVIGHAHHGQTLALSAVSNIGGNDLAEALSADVQRLIISPLDSGPSYNMGINSEEEFRNKALLCKKAALCLLRLFRTNPECVTVDEWMSRLARLLEDRDIGVVTSVMSLLLGFASTSTGTFEPLVPYVVSILTRLVVNRSCAPDYLYYNIPSPWLQVKCLRFLQYYKVPSDGTQLDLLNEVLIKILVKGENPGDTYNKINADNSVLFEAINLVISYGSDGPSTLKDHACSWLGRFIATKDPNIRYLGIDAMTRLAKLDGPDSVQVYQHTVLDSLKDVDISLRKRALNLLYLMSNHNNAKEVVGELVHHLPLADPAIKEDIVVKMAILSEKYTDDFRWYVDTMIQAVLLAGDYVAEAVWYRIVQIVVNNPDIHEYAAEKMLQSVQSKFAHETMVAVAGYLLGEIGVNICENPGMTGYDQFAALHQHFANVSPKVRCILMTTYAKLLNLYPEVKDLIMDVYAKYVSASHLELQQRAVEYKALSGISAETIEAVLNTMPAFEKRESLLMAIENAESSTADRSAWSVGQTEKSASRAAFVDSRKPKGHAETSPVAEKKALPAVTVAKAVDLLSLDDDFGSPFGGNSGGSGAGLTAEQTATIERNNRRICLVRGLTNKSDVVSTDLLHISAAHDYRAHQGRLVLSIINNSTSEIDRLEAQFAASDALSIQQKGLSTRLSPGEETNLQVAIDCMRPFEENPSVTLTFNSHGSKYSYHIPLPVNVSSFCDPLPMDKATYMARWKAITAEGTENQAVFNSSKPVDANLLNYIKNTLFPGSRLGLAEGLDNERTATGSCSFLTGTVGADGKKVAVGALMRLEADVANNKYRITVRATQPTVSAAFKNYIVHQLS